MHRQRHRAGFTLLEVALAIVVVAVGVLGLFALLSTGLDASSKAVATTQAAFFADATFGALRAQATEKARRGLWEQFWTDFAAGAPEGTLTVAAPSAWEGFGGAQELKVSGDGTVRILMFRNREWNRRSTVLGVPSGNLRYQLLVRLDPETVATRRARQVTLLVWTGAGSTTGLEAKDAMVFYSEFANVGTL